MPPGQIEPAPRRQTEPAAFRTKDLLARAVIPPTIAVLTNKGPSEAAELSCFHSAACVGASLKREGPSSQTPSPILAVPDQSCTSSHFPYPSGSPNTDRSSPAWHLHPHPSFSCRALGVPLPHAKAASTLLSPFFLFSSGLKSPKGPSCCTCGQHQQIPDAVAWLRFQTVPAEFPIPISIAPAAVPSQKGHQAKAFLNPRCRSPCSVNFWKGESKQQSPRQHPLLGNYLTQVSKR